MKLPIIPSKLKKFWDEWDLRLLIISSLSLQAFLLLLAPSRQRSRSKLLSAAVWTTYLLADWVAAVSIGQITKTIGDSDSHNNDRKSELYAVWASFLLVHLGGPDGITSLALEDNELWLRHLFGLAVQSLSAFYGLYLTLASSTLYGLNLLVFVAGNIKFGERTWALYSASLANFGATVLPEPNPGPDYEDAMAEHAFNKIAFPAGEGRLGAGAGAGAGKFGMDPATIGPPERNSEEMKMLDVAYSLFGTFRGLLVGFLISSKDRDSTRSYFLREEPLRAFRLVEYELSFVYQVLHTKSVLVYSVTGCVLRAISFFTMLGASVYFVFVEKRGFGRFETRLTYALFFGAVALEIYSILKLLISDWTLMALKETRVIRNVPGCYLTRSRWSGSVSQKNAIGFCLSPAVLSRELWRSFRRNGVSETLWMKLRNASYSERVSDKAKEFIVDELKRKSRSASGASTAAEACSQRGDSALLESPSSYIKLNWSIREYQYVESVLLWHLATQLCLHQDDGGSRTQNSDSLRVLLTRLCFGNQNSDNNDHRKFSKMMSEYLFYLLIDKPEMLAPVLGNWNVVFQDTCAEAKRHFEKHEVTLHSKACEKIVAVGPRVRSADIKGNRSASVLFDSCILAKQLMKESERWKIMSRVWVELLSYAAINCRPFLHAQQLSKGGELLTFVWLLMNQLGLGTQFAEQEQTVGTRMVTIT